MKIRVHIGQVVLDDAPPGLDRAALTEAIRAELTRLLTERPVTPSAVAVPVVRPPHIGAPAGTAAALGAQIAGAVHAALPGSEGAQP